MIFGKLLSMKSIKTISKIEGVWQFQTYKAETNTNSNIEGVRYKHGGQHCGANLIRLRQLGTTQLEGKGFSWYLMLWEHIEILEL